MNEMARSVRDNNSVVFITVPNNGNWVFNALGWNNDHCIAFFRDIAYRFVSRSDLGQHTVLVAPCMQKYLWYWKIVYALSLFQPFSWGFLVLPEKYQPNNNEIEHILKALRAFTAAHFWHSYGRIENEKNRFDHPFPLYLFSHSSHRRTSPLFHQINPSTDGSSHRLVRRSYGRTKAGHTQINLKTALST